MAAKSTDCVFFFLLISSFVLTFTGSSKFKERQSVDDNFNDCIREL